MLGSESEIKINIIIVLEELLTVVEVSLEKKVKKIIIILV
jgi:hypothetical protein